MELGVIKLIAWPGSRKTALSKVEKYQARELAEAKMNLAQCESSEEYYRHQAEMYRQRIERIEGREQGIRVGGTA